MGLTRQYVRYAQSGVFGVVGSSNCNIIYLNINGCNGRFCAVGACENVIIWDLRTGEQFKVLAGEKHDVTVICMSPDSRHLAAGYANGSVKIFEISSGETTLTFNGHKTAVSALKFDHKGLRLVSGGKDTDVIVWDVVAECGLYRLRGHKGLITQVHFMKDLNILVSSSKDTFVKFWDLDTQHCFKTLVGHRSEIYDFLMVQEDTLLLTGSADSEIRLWQIVCQEKETEPLSSPIKRPRLDDEDQEENDTSILECVKLGSVMRQGRSRLVSMATDAKEKILLCHGNSNLLDVFKILSKEELKKHLAKRQKKIKRKQKDTETEDITKAELTPDDRIPRFNSVKLSGKLRSVAVHTDNNAVSHVVSLLTNNTVETCAVEIVNKNSELSPMVKLSQRGHRSDVRTVSFSSDSTAILSASGDSVKIWNRTSLQPIRTMQCGYALCSLFTPGDRHVLIGTKSGHLELYDLASGTLLEEIPAHTGALWSISMSPDKRGIVSGSADHEVKFWNFELVEDESQTASKRLTLEHTRTLKMDEDVLCVKYSPDQRLLAVALLDNTVKVFFADTLKFFLSLYGHKLPVLCLDISSDSTLIVTGSADRNIKIWGLDFGDCHKSIFAHDDSIMCVQFVPKTHFLFTGGKDGKVKEWDGDNFEHIQTLEGHRSEVWCLAVSPSGNFVVSGSHDKSLRLWEKTQEPLILDEEREMEREREHEESIGQGEEPVVAGETTTEVKLAGKKTLETVKAAERIMESLIVYKEEESKLASYRQECLATGKQLPEPALNPLLMAYKVTRPDQYVLEVLKKVKSSELEESLLVLPFDCVVELIQLLQVFLEESWEVELATRCLLFLLKIHQGQITSNRVLLPVINKLRHVTPSKADELKDRIGFNMAGLQFLKRHFEESEQVQLFADATEKMKQKKKKEKKKAILTIHT